MWNALVGAPAPAPALRFAALCAPTRPTLPRGVLLVLCKHLTLSARASPGGAYPEARFRLRQRVGWILAMRAPLAVDEEQVHSTPTSPPTLHPRAAPRARRKPPNPGARR